MTVSPLPQPPGKSQSSKMGSGSWPDPRIRNCFLVLAASFSPTCPSHPTVPGSTLLEGRWSPEQPTEQESQQMNQIQEKQGRPPEELLPLTSWLPRSEAISFRLFHEQWVSNRRSRGRAGANFRAGGVVDQLPGEVGWAPLVSNTEVPGCPGHFNESWATLYRKE